ncbi:D-2-hydroxyacid dehydrogenase [uncultured Castellaniella sp.]|uniref:D-2-hydroxyacid dehydrogenase n=1 Tax=uncultured Castellaniella sp. TaxID=647907 RepID=UPI0026357636|nr:D-2-hydroxyacid dehydrogenase [uncultured Castellaniella sp.]
MDPLRIVFLDRDTLPASIDIPAPAVPHEWVAHARTRPDQVAERILDADIIITNKVALTADVLQQAPRLRMVALAATGTDNVDLDACNQRRIIVSNVRDYAVHTVPEHTFALMLALRRNLLAYRQSVADGRWHESGQFCYFDFPVRDLAGSTLGIIGRGALGEAVAEIARAFDMRVQFAARRDAGSPVEDYTSFTHVLRTSDVISLHCPLNDQTRGMIGAAEFALMDRKPLLINTARGGLVDEQALEHALQTGQISGAGFDVATREPPPPDHPILRLLRFPNFILTPHVAWASEEAIRAMAHQVRDNIEAFCRDAPRNVVAGFHG